MLYIHEHDSKNVFSKTKLNNIPLRGLIEDGVLYLRDSVTEDEAVEIVIHASPRLREASLKPILAITYGHPHKEQLFRETAKNG